MGYLNREFRALYSRPTDLLFSVRIKAYKRCAYTRYQQPVKKRKQQRLILIYHSADHKINNEKPPSAWTKTWAILDATSDRRKSIDEDY